MKNTIQIRKCQSYTVTESTEVANLNPEEFRNLESDPFTGETEEEFLHYIKEFEFRDAPDDLDLDQAEELGKLFQYAEWKAYYYSTEHEDNSWLEAGKANPEYRKSGGFESEYSTHGDS